jgi:hypothetical protein
MTTSTRPLLRPNVPRRRWPLLVIGASAGAATWSGWVGLGQLTGFGVVHPLPGIWDSATLNTAITLPIGVEAYAIYALAVATDTRPHTPLARRFAWASAFAALALGMAGQITYHLLAARDVLHAPTAIVAAVSCLPVLVLGAASLLWHLAAQPAPAPALDSVNTTTASSSAAETVTTADALDPALVPAVRMHSLAMTDAINKAEQRTPVGAGAPAVATTAPTGSHGQDRRGPSDEQILATIDGQVPSMRALMRSHSIGQTRASRIRNDAIRRNQQVPEKRPNQERQESQDINPPQEIDRPTDANSNNAPEIAIQDSTKEQELDTDTCITDRVGPSRSHDPVILTDSQGVPNDIGGR